MIEIQDLDMMKKIDSHRRQELIELLAPYVTDPELFREDRERWKSKIRRRSPDPQTWSQSWFNDFMEKMLKGIGSHPDYYGVEYYENWYRKSREICRMMKILNDGHEPMSIEWITVTPGI
jgi:hypothetical protein